MSTLLWGDPETITLTDAVEINRLLEALNDSIPMAFFEGYLYYIKEARPDNTRDDIIRVDFVMCPNVGIA